MASSSGADLPPGTNLCKGKVVVIGEYSVGKTSLSNRFVLQHCPSRTEPTIGAAFQLRTIMMPNSNNAVKLEIWDTAGSERYRSLMPMYYRDASAALVCYDICNAKTFDRVSAWIDDFRKSAEQNDTSKNPLVVLVGTKSDLAAAGKREIELEVAQLFAKEENLVHFETSAKLNENVTEAFLAVASHIVKETKAMEAEKDLRIAASNNGMNGGGGRGPRGQKVDLKDDTSVGGFRRRRDTQSPNGEQRKTCSC